MPDTCPGSREVEGEAIGSQVQPLLRVPSHSWPLQTPHGKVTEVSAAARTSRELQERKHVSCSGSVLTACPVATPEARTADPPARRPRGARPPLQQGAPSLLCFPLVAGVLSGPAPSPVSLTCAGAHPPASARKQGGLPAPPAPSPPAPPRTPPAQDPAQGRSALRSAFPEGRRAPSGTSAARLRERLLPLCPQPWPAPSQTRRVRFFFF